MAGWLIGGGVLAVAVLSALAFWQLARDRRAAPDRDGAVWVLRPSRAMAFGAAVLGVAAAGFAAGAGAAAVSGRFGPADAVLAGAAAVCGGGLWWARRIWQGYRVTYDEAGLSVLAPGREALRVAWADLADVRLETRRHRGSMAGPPVQVTHLVARLPGGALLRIPATLTGFSHFSDMALRIADRLGTRGQDRDA